jgi:hypothetical protein
MVEWGGGIHPAAISAFTAQSEMPILASFIISKIDQLQGPYSQQLIFFVA